MTWSPRGDTWYHCPSLARASPFLTSPALSGVIQHAQTREAADPTRKVVAVLATDGLPTECDPQEIADVADLARAGLEGTPSVETYVIGVFSEIEAAEAEANLNQIAAAGGTEQAFVISTDTDVAASFLAALSAIRGAALACDFAIPEPEAGTQLDFGRVNLQFVDSEGNGRQLVNSAGRGLFSGGRQRTALAMRQSIRRSPSLGSAR